MHDFFSELKDARAAGRKTIACFPLYPPVELIHSMGLAPAVLWGLAPDRAELAAADRQVQNYVCSVGRRLAGFMALHGSRLFDAFFSYNACDTLRNLPELVTEAQAAQGQTLPWFFLHLPQTSAAESTWAGYLDRALAELIEKISAAFGQEFSRESFVRSVALYREARSLCLGLEEKCRKGKIPFARFSDAAMAGHFLPVQSHIELLNAVLNEGARKAGEGAPGVLLSGILPPPAGVAEAIYEAGLRVAGNDLAALYRSYSYTPSCEERGPAAYYRDFYENRFPCTTLLRTADRRVEALLSRVRECGAKAVIFVGEKFCEYEYFELPFLSESLKGQGIPLLFLEMGIDDRDNVAALRNRVFAFAEMLQG